MFMGTPSLSCSSHRCTCRRSRCTPRNWCSPRCRSRADGSRRSHRSCRAATSRAWGTDGTDIPWSPRVPGLWGASPGGVRPAPTPADGAELPACTVCRAELSTPGNLRPSLKEETKTLSPRWGDGASATHPVSSDCSRPNGHRHWLALQELCHWKCSSKAPSSSQAASLRKPGTAQSRGGTLGRQEGAHCGARQRQMLTCRGF